VQHIAHDWAQKITPAACVLTWCGRFDHTGGITSCLQMGNCVCRRLRDFLPNRRDCGPPADETRSRGRLLTGTRQHKFDDGTVGARWHDGPPPAAYGDGCLKEKHTLGIQRRP